MGKIRVTYLAALTAATLAPTAAAAATPSGTPATSDMAFANHCLALKSVALGRLVSHAGPGGYRANTTNQRRSGRFYLKPTGLRHYLLFDRGRRLMAVDGTGAAVVRVTAPGPPAVWTPSSIGAGAVAIRSTASGRYLAVGAGGNLTTAVARGPASRFALLPARSCSRFPEAFTGARGKTFKGTRQAGGLLGFADMHLHITADMRAGGDVVYGENFDPFGIAEALGHDDRAHGPDGSLDATGNLLRPGSPTGTHDTHGWPTFTGWPVYDTYTHQQTYYVWLKRVWLAGERLVTAQTVEDEPLCRLEPRRTHTCDETTAVELQIARLRGLQNYVDAQAGGRGRGWFRLVYSPAQARAAIARGKLAVLIGMESSDALGCSEREGVPQCTKADIDNKLDALYRDGLRSMFIAHWVDNAFAGAAFESGATGQFIDAMQVEETGQPFASEKCHGAADEADGNCNAKGLTALGRYLVQRLMAKHMLIEVDHLSQKARATVLAMAEAAHYPLVSSHTGTGGAWTPSQLRRLYALGGLASARSADAPGLAKRIGQIRADVGGGQFFCVGLGTDTGGFNALPGPRAGASSHPLRYPFRAYAGGVTFVRQRSGTRVYDLNKDGVAHYGLFADVIADLQRQAGGGSVLPPLFHSAAAYLRMWDRAEKHG